MAWFIPLKTPRALRKAWRRKPCPAGEFLRRGTFGPDEVACCLANIYVPEEHPIYPVDACIDYETCGLWQAEKRRIELRRSLHQIQQNAQRRAA